MEILDRIRDAIAIYVEPRHYLRAKPIMPPGVSDESLYMAAEAKGFTRSADAEYTAAQARADMERIVSANAAASVRYDALHMLDIRVQNQTETSRNQVINEICERQYELVKDMERGGGYV